MSCHVPLAGLIDVTAELKRTDKAILKAQKEIEKIEKKLANENYIAKAPEHVVADAKQHLLMNKRYWFNYINMLKKSRA